MPSFLMKMLERASTGTARLVGAALVCPDVPDLAGDGEDLMSGICAVWRKDNPRHLGQR